MIKKIFFLISISTLSNYSIGMQKPANPPKYLSASNPDEYTAGYTRVTFNTEEFTYLIKSFVHIANINKRLPINYRALSHHEQLTHALAAHGSKLIKWDQSSFEIEMPNNTFYQTYNEYPHISVSIPSDEYDGLTRKWKNQGIFDDVSRTLSTEEIGNEFNKILANTYQLKLVKTYDSYSFFGNAQKKYYTFEMPQTTFDRLFREEKRRTSLSIELLNKEN